VFAFLGAAGIILLAAAVVTALVGWAWAAAACTLGGLGLLVSAAGYLYTTRRGKFAVWADVLRGLHLRGDEQLLDMGCGRGAVLLMAAQLLPEGRAVGLDLWLTRDQSGNSLAAAMANAEREGVAPWVEVRTGDMTAMPFEDRTFDVVLSSLAIHNVGSAANRDRAIREAVRVLRPGGRLLIADIFATSEYVERLRHQGMDEVSRRPLGWRFWFGNPATATRLVTATRPN
jgi:ubiquinone/menaquinone biosynthesis C-methylase UbiE